MYELTIIEYDNRKALVYIGRHLYRIPGDWTVQSCGKALPDKSTPWRMETDSACIELGIDILHYIPIPDLLSSNITIHFCRNGIQADFEAKAEAYGIGGISYVAFTAISEPKIWNNYYRQIQTLTGPKGNCFSTCIACLLRQPSDTVPNFCHDSTNLNWRVSTNIWLHKMGLFYIDIRLPGDMRDELRSYWGYHVISGDGPRGHRHSVVGHHGEIFHDPHPSGDGLYGTPDVWEYGFLIPHQIRQG